MNIDSINELSKEIFIINFNNIFEKSIFITKKAESKRPYRDKEHMINIFLSIFDSLKKKSKIQIIKNHPDLGNKIKINSELTKLSQEEQRKAGLIDCTQQEFKQFNKLNSAFKLKFNIPFIFAVRGKNKNEILNEFHSRLRNLDINSEIDISVEQVKRIALLRLEELIDG